MPPPVEPIRNSDAVRLTYGPDRAAVRPPGLRFSDETPGKPRIEQAAPRPVQGLSLPLPAVSAPRTVSLTPVAALLPQRMPAPQDVRDLAQDALGAAADTRNLSPSRLAAEAPVVAASRLPSRNAIDAQALASAAVLVRDEGGDLATLDVHVARHSLSGWEATVFDRADAAPAGVFPYAAMPLAVVPLQFDPARGALVLTSGRGALQILMPAPQRNTTMSMLRPAFVIALLAFAAAAAMAARFLA